MSKIEKSVNEIVLKILTSSLIQEDITSKVNAKIEKAIENFLGIEEKWNEVRLEEGGRLFNIILEAFLSCQKDFGKLVRESLSKIDRSRCTKIISKNLENLIPKMIETLFKERLIELIRPKVDKLAEELASNITFNLIAQKGTNPSELSIDFDSYDKHNLVIKMPYLLNVKVEKLLESLEYSSETKVERKKRE